MLGWLVGGAGAIAVAIAAYLWYNANRLASAETTAASQQALAEDEANRAKALEAAAAENRAAEALKDKDEADKIVATHDGAAGIGFLRDSFKDRHNSN